MRKLLVGLWLLAGLPLGAVVHARADVPVVAVASNLQFVMGVIIDDFKRVSGREVRLVFGSSGNLSRQIRSGAPFQLFLSADAAYVENLYRDGLTRDAGEEYALGRLALIVPRGSSLRLDEGLSDGSDEWLGAVSAALAAGDIRRFAIPSPEHAPYGIRAREVLQAAGLWTAVEPLLVLGENVSQAAQFVASGNADVGITAWSLVLAEDVARLSHSQVLPASAHRPLRQRMVLMPEAGETAVALYEYLLTPAAQAVLMDYGFTVTH